MEIAHTPSFGGFRLDLENERLMCDDEIVALTPKGFAVLRCLVERGGRLVRKEDLLRAGWPNTHVSAAVLKVAILEIRRALGDDSAAPLFIETVPRRGYRFIARVGRASPSTGSTPAADGGTLVGRAGLLARLDERLESARAGTRQVVFLSGEAGIGKTAVLESFLARAAVDPDVWVARGECLEHYGVAEAYMPVLDALGRLCREPGRERVITLLEAHAPTWLVQLPWALRDRGEARRDLFGTTKERMLREMSEALEALTSETLLVLVLEDLHWSDYSTLDLLTMLARRQEPAKLLVVASYRPVDVIVTGHPLRAVTQELRARGHCDDVPVDFLSADDVAAYLAARFPGHAFPVELAAAVHRRTDGNALFMVRLVDELVAIGAMAQTEACWRLEQPLTKVARALPGSLRDLIEKQIGRLDPQAQRMLEVASMLGSEFTARSLAAGLDADPDEVEERCDAIAERGELIAPAALHVLPNGMPLALYRFTHSLYPSVFAERISPGRRLRCHQRLGAWLESTYGPDVGLVGTEVARHFEEAHDYRRAIEHLQRAAERDLHRWANQEAVTRLIHALDLVPFLSAPDTDVVLPVLHEQIGRARRASADFGGAAAAFDALADWARQRRHVGWEAKAALYRASVLAWIDPAASRTASQEGVALSSRVDDPRLRAHLRGYAAYWDLQQFGWRADDERLAENAVQAARESGDRELLAHAVVRRVAFQSLRSEYRAALRTIEEGLELALESGSAYDYLACYHFRADSLRNLGEWGAVLTTLDEGIQMATRNGHGPWAGLLRLQLAALHVEALDFAGAAAIAREEAKGIGNEPVRQSALHELVPALLGLGESVEAERLMADSRALSEAEVIALPCRHQMTIRQLVGQLDLERDDLASARRQADAFVALAAAVSDPLSRARAAQLSAEIALRADDLDTAEACTRSGLDAIGRYELPVVEWRLAALTARIHERRKRREDAKAGRLRALAIVARLGDSVPADHALRRAFLEHPLVRELFDQRASSPRTRRPA